ncbi:MAG TPA: hypothetical protein VHA14_12485, partial [Bryobacteraceae bacterium]|nr:hypothetical protein [Bryobacteraceae bacterium]
SKPVQAGDQIGEFKIVSLDLRKVKFEWEGRELDRNLDELSDRSATPAATAAGNALANQSSGPAVAPPPPSQPAQPTSAALGAESGSADAPTRLCVQGDNSAIGSVVDGYKKTGVATPFGTMGCKWVKQ